MASSSAPSAKNSAGAAVAAAAATWTPTGGRAIIVRSLHHGTGGYYLEARYDSRASSKSAERKTITPTLLLNAHATCNDCVLSLSCHVCSVCLGSA